MNYITMSDVRMYNLLNTETTIFLVRHNLATLLLSSYPPSPTPSLFPPPPLPSLHPLSLPSTPSLPSPSLHTTEGILPSRGEHGNKADTTYSLMYSKIYGVPPHLFLSFILQLVLLTTHKTFNRSERALLPHFHFCAKNQGSLGMRLTLLSPSSSSFHVVSNLGFPLQILSCSFGEKLLFLFPPKLRDKIRNGKPGFEATFHVPHRL